jgi:hypothetical protein
MSQFYIINESTEDTFESTDNLQDAIRVAREVARQGQAGDPVSILESGGKAVRQFVLMPDGTVSEQAMARQVKLSGVEAELNRAELGAVADRPRD